MRLKILCPNCKHKLSVSEKLAGRTAKCPACRQPFSVVLPVPDHAAASEASSEEDDSPTTFSVDDPERRLTLSICPSVETPIGNHLVHVSNEMQSAKDKSNESCSGTATKLGEIGSAARGAFVSFLGLSRQDLIVGSIAISLVTMAAGLRNHGAWGAFIGLLWLLGSAGTFIGLRFNARRIDQDTTDKFIACVACPLVFTWSLLWMFGIVGAPFTGNPRNEPPSNHLTTHPVFHTTVSGRSQARPAIQVDIKDDSEGPFDTAELYLAVQSSRFPSSTWVILPLNVGNFAGCRSRFVQLPFEVEEGDKLLFNLLDEDDLTREQEQLVISGCRLCGYCLLVAGKLYAPHVEILVRPAIPDAAELLGAAILSEVTLKHFDNMGTAEFIVPRELPSEPQLANKLAIMDGNYVRAELRLYGPISSLAFTPTLNAQL